MVRPAGITSPTDKTGYTGLDISLAGASLVGVDGLTFKASGHVLINKATTAAGTAAAERINWATATDTAGLLPSFSSELTKSVALQVGGSVSLNAFGFVVGTAEVHDDAGDERRGYQEHGAGCQRSAGRGGSNKVTLGDLNLFAGTGGTVDDHGTANDVTDDTVSTVGAVGFSVNGGSVTLAMVRPAGITSPTDKSGYTRLDISLAGASLVGVDGLTFKASGHVLINKATTAAGTAAAERIDWATATDTAGLLPSFKKALTKSVALQVGGSVGLSVASVLYANAAFTMTQSTVTGVDDPDDTTGKVLTGDLLAISITDATLFIGNGGSLNTDSTSPDYGTVTLPASNDPTAVGFFVSHGSLHFGDFHGNSAGANDERDLHEFGRAAQVYRVGS